MKYNTKILVIILLAIGVLVVSCKQQGNKIPQITNDPISDTIKRDIPAYFDAKLLREKKELQDSLHIQDLENGFTGMQIRIWSGSSPDTLKLLDLINTNGSWKGSFYNINYKSPLDGGTIKYVGSALLYKVPKSGWRAFTEVLFGLDILTLPDCSQIKDYDVPTDASSVTVEIANQKMYRLYAYQMPHENRRISEAAKMIKILDLTEKEFDIKWQPN